ncbi:hypothetical protein ACFQV8_13570 [Pseudonocardia benzenivorans]
MSDDALVASTAALLRQGFRARTAVHPRQVPSINAAFTPSTDELDRARGIVETLESAGSGVAVDPARAACSTRRSSDRPATSSHGRPLRGKVGVGGFPPPTVQG